MENNNQENNNEQPQPNSEQQTSSNTSEENSGRWNFLYIIVAIVLTLLLIKFLIPILTPHEYNTKTFIEDVNTDNYWLDWSKKFNNNE